MLRGEQAGVAGAGAVATVGTGRRRRHERARRVVAGRGGPGPGRRSRRRSRRRDVDGCVAAVLGLEEAIAAWQADTLQSDDADEARRVLRALVVRLGELAEQGAADPADAVAPFVEALLAVRAGARDERRTSRPRTWCGTGWSRPASRCATPPRAPPGP